MIRRRLIVNAPWRIRGLVLWLGLAAPVGLWPAVHAQVSRYVVEDLGDSGIADPLREEQSNPFRPWVSINARGQMAVTRRTEPGGVLHAFRYTNGIGFESLEMPGDVGSIAYGLNRAGQVVGTFARRNGPRHAFLYDKGRIDIGEQIPGGGASAAYAVNARRQVVGTDRLVGGFLWQDDTVTRLGLAKFHRDLGYDVFTEAYGVSSRGLIVGTRYLEPAGCKQAILWSHGLQVEELLPRQGLCDATREVDSYGTAVNDNGVAVGYSNYLNGQTNPGRAFRWGPLKDLANRITDLGTLGGLQSKALAINNAGQIVGWSKTAGGDTHAFFFDGSVLRDLNDLADPAFGCGTPGRCKLVTATGINAAGQIVGIGRINGVDGRIFRLRPIGSGQRDFRVQEDPRAVVMSDFNADLHPDLAVANFASDSVSILLWETKRLAEIKDFPAGEAPAAAVLANFSREDIPDLAVVSRDSDEVIVLAGETGAHRFGAPQSFAVGMKPSAAAADDFDGDNHPDLVVVNSESNNVSVLLRNPQYGKPGEPLFLPASTVAVGAMPSAIVVGDFNGDNKADLAVANMGSNNISILLGNGDGTFTPGTPIVVGAMPNAIAVGDFNGDNKADLAVTNRDSNNVSILLGNGDGTFTQGTPIMVGMAPSAIVVGDFNQDNKADLAVTNRDSNNVSVLLGNGDGTFAAPQNYETGMKPSAVAISDFNNDDKPDLAVANTDSDSVSVLRGQGDGTFMMWQTVPVGRAPVALATREVLEASGERTKGLVVINAAANAVMILSAEGTYGPARHIPVGTNPSSVAAGDFDGDNTQDLAVANMGSDNVSILLGNGDGTFRDTEMPVKVGTAPSAIAVGDFNGDNKADLAVANMGSDNVSILLGNGDGTFTPGTPIKVGTAPSAIAVGDFNGDDKPDLAVANMGSDNVSILLGNGDGTFAPGTPIKVGTAPSAIVTGNFNSNDDNNLDLAVANMGSDNVSLLLGNGDGTFVLAQDLEVGAAPSSLAVIDYNLDGIPDLVVSNKDSGDASILVGDAQGGFDSQGPVGVFCLPTAIAAGFIEGFPLLAVTGRDRQRHCGAAARPVGAGAEQEDLVSGYGRCYPTWRDQ